jgi:hypothetical protein
MIRQAFNAILKMHGRAAVLKRLGTPDIETAIRISPSNYFRNLEGPSHTTVEGREFIIPLDSIESPFTPTIKRGDRIVDSVIGIMTIDEIREVHDLGGGIMGYRARCE